MSCVCKVPHLAPVCLEERAEVLQKIRRAQDSVACETWAAESAGGSSSSTASPFGGGWTLRQSTDSQLPSRHLARIFREEGLPLISGVDRHNLLNSRPSREALPAPGCLPQALGGGFQLNAEPWPWVTTCRRLELEQCALGQWLPETQRCS